MFFIKCLTNEKISWKATWKLHIVARRHENESPLRSNIQQSSFETFMGCLMYMYVCRRELRHFVCIRLPSANEGRVFAIPHSSINTPKHRTAFQSYNINVI